MGKRNAEDPDGIEKLKKKLKKLERKLEKITNNNKDPEQEEPVEPTQLDETIQSDKTIQPDENIQPDETVQPDDNIQPDETVQPDESIINLLGDEGEEQENSTIIHGELKKRWQSILKDGLSKEARETLMKKYQVPKNCTELTPPLLNDLIKEVLNEAGINRDKRIIDKQKKLGLAISALGTILSKLLDYNAQENKETIETLSDSCRLLCDIFHSDSITRKSLIIPGLNKDMKGLIDNVHITEYLFGNDLQEKVKACKATKSSAKDLKIPQPAKTSVPHNKRPVALNSRGPLRSAVQPRPSGPPFRAAVQPRPAPPQRQQPKTNYYRPQQRSSQQQQRRR